VRKLVYDAREIYEAAAKDYDEGCYYQPHSGLVCPVNGALFFPSVFLLFVSSRREGRLFRLPLSTVLKARPFPSARPEAALRRLAFLCIGRR
jgi:hypothetical protein